MIHQPILFILHIANQKVRQFTVKTADDRLASIWSLNMKTPKQSFYKLETTIEKLMEQQGNSYYSLQKKLIQADPNNSRQSIYAY